MLKSEALVACIEGSRLDVKCFIFFFQAEDGIRDLVRSRGLGDVYKRQHRGQRETQRVRRPSQRAGRAGNANRWIGDLSPQLSLIHI